MRSRKTEGGGGVGKEAEGITRKARAQDKVLQAVTHRASLQ